MMILTINDHEFQDSFFRNGEFIQFQSILILETSVPSDKILLIYRKLAQRQPLKIRRLKKTEIMSSSLRLYLLILYL